MQRPQQHPPGAGGRRAPQRRAPAGASWAARARQTQKTTRRTPPPLQTRLGVDMRARQSAASRVAPIRTAVGERQAGSSHVRRLRLPPALAAPLAVALVFGAVALWALTSPTVSVRQVRVEGTTDPAITRAVQALPLAGCPVVHCDLAQRTRAVEALPVVARASLRTVLPDTLVVHVTPRRPALLWRTGANGETRTVVASDGVALGPLDDDPTYAALQLPEALDPQGVAFGGQTPQPGQRLDALTVEMAGQLRIHLTATLGDGWTLSYTGDSGFVATRNGGPRVLFGGPAAATAAATETTPGASVTAPVSAPPDAARVAQGARLQLAEARAILTQLAQQGKTPTLIDVRWGAHPYYTLD